MNTPHKIFALGMAALLASSAAQWASAQTYLKTSRSEISQSATGVRELADGSVVYVAEGQRSFGPQQGVVARFSVTGDVLWAIELEDNGQEELHDVDGSEDGQVMAVGVSNFQPWLVALNRSTGQVNWQRVLDRDGEYFSVATLEDGVAAAGITIEGDLLVTRYDLSGNLQWEGVYGWSTSNEVAYSIRAHPAGGLLVAGNTTQFEVSGAANLWLLKLDDAGVVEWANSIGDDDVTEGIFVDMDVTPSGAAVLVGALNFGGDFEDNALVARVRSDGSLDWIQSMDVDRDESRSIAATADEGCVVLSQTQGLGTDNDLWLAGLDASGARRWERMIGNTTEEERAGSVVVTRHGGILLAASPTKNFTFFDTDLFRLEEDGLAAVSCSSIRDVTSSRRFRNVSEFRTLPPASIGPGADSPAAPIRSSLDLTVDTDCVGCNVNLWQFGKGLAGSGGFVPDISGTEGACDGTGNRTITIDNGLGGALAFLLVGLGDTDAAAFGGTLYVDLTQFWFLLRLRLDGGNGVPGDGGWFHHSTSDLEHATGTELFFQALVLDTAAPKNFAMTDAMGWIIGN